MENHATPGSYGNIHFISFRKGTSGQYIQKDIDAIYIQILIQRYPSERIFKKSKVIKHKDINVEIFRFATKRDTSNFYITFGNKMPIGCKTREMTNILSFQI